MLESYHPIDNKFPKTKFDAFLMERDSLKGAQIHGDKEYRKSKEEESNACTLNVSLEGDLKNCNGPVTLTPDVTGCLLYTSPSPRDLSTSRMPSSA